MSRLLSSMLHTQILRTAILATFLGNISGVGAAEYPQAVVATSHPLATAAGVEILRAGGNAVDAAAAVQFALNVVEPQSSGLGGGAFIMIHWARTGEDVVIDARETAPAMIDPTQFAGRDFERNSSSGFAVGVPGTLAGFEMALQRWGMFSLGRDLGPALELARQGFPVTPYLAQALQSPRLTLYPATRRRFVTEKGTPLQLGERLYQPELARTLELIAAQGSKVFYRGPIARAIVAAQRHTRIGSAGRGRMTMADLSAYHPVLRAPLIDHYRSYKIVTMPPPSAGGVALLQVLKMLDLIQPPLRSEPGLDQQARISRIHRTIEALRWALEDRHAWIGDPDATTIAVRELLSVHHLQERARQIQPQRVRTGPDSPLVRDGRQTTHFSIMDSAGNVVTCTSTIEALWGSGIWVPAYGFFLNNELTDFNSTPQASFTDPGANDLRPRRRPASSMTPTMIFDAAGNLRYALGSPGGVTIISTVVEAAQDLLDLNWSPEQFLVQARFAVLGAAGAVSLEPGFPESWIPPLSAMGHTLTRANSLIGSVQMVGQMPSSLRRWGVADQRRDGTTGGF